MEKPIYNRTDILKGISTLDAIGKNLRIFSLLMIITILSGTIYGGTGHSILDAVDPNFNVQLRTDSFASKSVSFIKVLPDNKILASGSFNSFNGQPVSSLIRLNADGTLDTSFNNNLFSAGYPSLIVLQTDGKIILGNSLSPGFTLNGQNQTANRIIRLNADGTVDSSFNYSVEGQVSWLMIDSNGRILVGGGGLQVTENGVSVNKNLIRLNADGTLDNSFSSPLLPFVIRSTVQGNKPIVAFQAGGSSDIIRLNENGSVDDSFIRYSGSSIYQDLVVQPDNKILAVTSQTLVRLNENGGIDGGFQQNFFPTGVTKIILSGNGKITVMNGNSPSVGFRFIRLLPDGRADPSFTAFVYTASPGAFGVQSDGGVIIGDVNNGYGTPIGSNKFIRLLPSGSVDNAFNSGGTGFQSIAPGRVRAITIQPDEKIVIGGNFDTVNGIFRHKIARLNADGTLDNSFQINTSGTGNRFSQIYDVFNIAVQQDGKLMVTGAFTYTINGSQRTNMVRLNADGSIDTTFNLSIPIIDTFSPSGGGQNRFVILNDGKTVVGISRSTSAERLGPVRLNSNGALDNTFSPTAYSDKNAVYIMDVIVQPDGKILIGGTYSAPNIPGSGIRSFIARLNSDGSADQTFQAYEETGEISTFRLLQDGKILIANQQSNKSNIFRLNTDGSIDSSFNAGTGANGRTNALLILESGKIMVGGKFTTFDGQPRGNLALINADGSLDPKTFNVDQEVLCLTRDGQGRVLVGGGFTSISVDGGQNQVRSYVARLIDSSAQAAKHTRFDFDGDGRADISVFRPLENQWFELLSSNLQVAQQRFGLFGDIIAPADYDGDGKTDIAIFRPSTGTWWYLSSIDNVQKAVRWGKSGDIPRPGDFDGDGKADFIVYRPSENTWYRLSSSTGQISITQFGLSRNDPFGRDDPFSEDFDGDGRSDLAIYRPSTGEWWYLASSTGSVNVIRFGIGTDTLVPADFDGDGKTDPAVYRASEATWYILNSSNNSTTITKFGLPGDTPTPADYDGDGRADIAVYRHSEGLWYLLQSSRGFAAIKFGVTGDRPTPSAFISRTILVD